MLLNMQAGYTIEFMSSGVCAGVAPDFRHRPDVIRPVQTHSCNVGVIPADGELPDLADTDAIVCLRQGKAIGVRTADCVPIIAYAPDIRAIAAIHAGWKGTLGRIADRAMRRMRELGADLSMAEAAFGPCICGRCYEISEELSDRFMAEGWTDCFTSHRHIDLQAANRKQLLAAGLRPERIHRNELCTRETPWLPSWRRQPTDHRLLTWISMP